MNRNVNVSEANPDSHYWMTVIAPRDNQPSGGTKVLYRLVELINVHLASGLRARVCSVEDPAFSCSWFRHQAEHKREYLFDREREFILLPEYLAGHLGPALVESGLAYGLFVQGGYLIHRNGPLASLRQVYERAAMIISISDDTSRCIEMVFPGLGKQVLRYTYAIAEAFSPPQQGKERLISYMPRKLGEQSQFVIAALAGRLAPGWQTLAIDGAPEHEVAAMLQRSSIFMAFSDQEGLPVPPVEAALAGNLVIGYHGEGGREYWQRPLFREVEKGNLQRFVAEVMQATLEIDQEAWSPDPDALARLQAHFSVSRQTELAQVIVARVLAALRQRSHQAPQRIDLSRRLRTPLTGPKSAAGRLKGCLKGLLRRA